MNISISMNIVLSLDCKKMVGDEITIAMTKLYKHRLGSDWTDRSVTILKRLPAMKFDDVNSNGDTMKL